MKKQVIHMNKRIDNPHTNELEYGKYSKNEYKKIYHISDIHLLGRKDRREFENVFSQMLQYIDGKNIDDPWKFEEIDERIDQNLKYYERDDNDIVFDSTKCCIITGDIIHSLIKLNAMIIMMIKVFIKKLNKRMATIIIPGNHDLNVFIKEKNEMDTLYSILYDQSLQNMIYIKDSGFYHIGSNITLSFIHPSEDHRGKYKNYLKPNQCVKPKKYMIAVYHGIVIPEKKEVYRTNRNKTYYDYTQFVDYHLTLLGDIHKACYIDKNNYMGYASSIVQMNFGEDEKEHGMIVWDVENRMSERVFFKNPYCFKNIYITKNGILKPTFMEHVKYLSLRLVYQTNASITKRNQVQEWIQKNIIEKGYQVLYQILQIKYHEMKREEGLEEGLEEILEIVGNEEEEKTKKEETYIENHTFSEDLEFYMKEMGKEYTKEMMEKLIKIYEEEVNKVQKDHNINEVVKNRNKWYVEKFQFSNLLSYGKYNTIDLTNVENSGQMGNVIGIQGPNTYGKSSIFDGICFVLFGETARGDNRDILRKGTDKGYYEIEIVVNDKDRYKIIRTMSIHSKKKNSGNVDTHIDFYKKDMDTNEWIPYLHSQTEIKKNIERIIGTYKNFISHSVFLQNSIDSIISMKVGDMYEYLFNVFELDIYRNIEKNKSQSNYNIKIYESRLNDLTMMIQKKKNENGIERYEERMNIYNGLEEKIEKNERRLEELEKELSELEKDEEICMQSIIIDQKYHGMDDKKLLYRKDYEIKMYQHRMKMNDVNKRIEWYEKRGKDVIHEMKKIKEENQMWEDRKSNIEEWKQRMMDELAIIIGNDITNRMKMYDSVQTYTEKILDMMEKEYMENRKNRIGRMDEIESEMDEKEVLIGEREEMIKVMEEMEKKVKELGDEEKSDRGEIEVSMEKIRMRLREKRNEIKEIEIENMNHRERREKSRLEIERYRGEMGEIEKMEEERERCKEMIDIIDEFYKIINMKSGIPAMRLRKYVEVLEEKMNMNMDIFGNYRFRILVNEKSIEMKIAKNRETNDYYPVQNASGFEKFFISILLKALIRDISNIPQSHMLFIDETISNLDKEHLNELENYIQQFCDHYYHDIFIITHLEEPMEWIENHMWIYRNEEKISKIIYGEEEISMSHYKFMDDMDKMKDQELVDQKDMMIQTGLQSSYSIIDTMKAMVSGSEIVPTLGGFSLTMVEKKEKVKRGGKKVKTI